MFDVVYARSLTSVLRDGDPSRFLKTVSILLKKGGWLKWHDCPAYKEDLAVVYLDPSRKRNASEQVVKTYQTYVPIEAFSPA